MTMPTIRMSTALLTVAALFAFAIAGSASAEVSEVAWFDLAEVRLLSDVNARLLRRALA